MLRQRYHCSQFREPPPHCRRPITLSRVVTLEKGEELRSTLWPESQRVAVETLGLQAAQEVQEVLLLSLRELVEVIDDRVRFRRSERRISRARVRLDCLDELEGSTVV